MPDQAPHAVDRVCGIVPVGVGADFAQRRGAKSIIDVQDLWPDAFSSLVPRSLRPLLGPAIWALCASARRAARGCDAIVGVADAYVQSALRETEVTKPTATIPLGVDLRALDAAAARGRCERFTKPPGDVWLAYTGSLNRNYDFMTILQVARSCSRPRGVWRNPPTIVASSFHAMLR